MNSNQREINSRMTHKKRGLWVCRQCSARRPLACPFPFFTLSDWPVVSGHCSLFAVLALQVRQTRDNNNHRRRRIFIMARQWRCLWTMPGAWPLSVIVQMLFRSMAATSSTISSVWSSYESHYWVSLETLEWWCLSLSTRQQQHAVWRWVWSVRSAWQTTISHNVLNVWSS